MSALARRTSRRRWLFSVLSLLALAVYVPRTFRSLALIGDSAEFLTAAALWGVPHAPGYPLYTLIAHVFTHLPVSELPFRVHLASACFHAVTVGIVGCIIELLTGSSAAAVLGAAILALGRIFFLGSLYAEVFPLADLLFAWLLYRVLRSAAPRFGRVRPWRWAAAAAVFGLAVAHHPMIALALPCLAILAGPPVLQMVRERPVSALPPLACALAPPVVLYALVPIAAAREPLLSWGDVHDVPSLLRLVTRQDYGGPFSASRRMVGGQLLERLDAFGLGTAQSFGAVGLVLAAAGMWWGFRNQRRACAALLAAIFCSGPLFAALNAFDIRSPARVAFFERFTTMCHVALAVLVGMGAMHVQSALRSHPRFRAAPTSVAAAIAALGALAVAPLAGNLGLLDYAHHRLGAAYARDLVDSSEDGALVLLKSDMASQAALFACAVEKRCGARIIVTPGQLWMPWKRRELERRYPELSLPPPDESSSAAKNLVTESLVRRPVYVHPELVDDVVHGELAVLPAMHLFRVYPNEESLRANVGRFRDQLEAMSRGARCQGCSIVADRPSRRATDAQLVFVYDQALRAHVRAAHQLGLVAEGDALAAWQGADR